MKLWLDQLIFGNGYGLKSPYFDDRYLWLSGELYTFNGWLGSQLQSFQWTMPAPGERRILCGRVFRPFSAERRWGRVRVSWAWEDLPKDLNEANIELEILSREIGKEHYGARLYKPVPRPVRPAA